MYLLTKELLSEFEKRDYVLRFLREGSREGDEVFASQRWLASSPAKRFMFDSLYGDLIAESTPEKHIADIGGGVSAFTRSLARHYYRLVEICAHDDKARIREIERQAGKSFLVDLDWFRWESQEQFDLVIANDLFPNVDQRLAMFLEKFLPCAREIRLTLTYYSEPRFYRAKRVDADELLCVLAWDGAQTARALEPFRTRIVDCDFALFTDPNESVFENRRQVCFVRLRGDGRS